MREVAVLINRKGVPVYWHVPKMESPTELPDDPDLWDAIWDHRHDLLGVAFASTAISDVATGAPLRAATRFAKACIAGSRSRKVARIGGAMKIEE